MVKPAALGDEERSLVLTKEEHPLPMGRREIVARIETLLAGGGVQKLVVEMKKPIRVERLVPADPLAQSPIEEPEDDLWNQLRNGVIEEYVPSFSFSSHENLMAIFDRVAGFRMRVTKCFVSDDMALWTWLKVAIPPETLFGVEVVKLPSVPSECFVLGAESLDPANPEVLGLRVPIDIPSKEQKS